MCIDLTYDYTTLNNFYPISITIEMQNGDVNDDIFTFHADEKYIHMALFILI